MSMINITENAQIVHSDLCWSELKEVLIELNYLNEKGYPKQEYIRTQEIALDHQGSDVWVSREMLQTLFNVVDKFVKDNGLPQVKKKLTFEELKAKYHHKPIKNDGEK